MFLKCEPGSKSAMEIEALSEMILKDVEIRPPQSHWL